MKRTASSKGIVMVLAMIFLVLFAGLAAAMASMSDINLQVSTNQVQADLALNDAQSGLEFMRYWINQVTLSDFSDRQECLENIATSWQQAENDLNITTGCAVYVDPCIIVPKVYLSDDHEDSFMGFIAADNNNINLYHVYAIGTHQTFSKVLAVEYQISSVGSSAFNFGISSRGPISQTGNASFNGVNNPNEADTFIESLNDVVALDMQGNSQIAGDVDIVNKLGTVDIHGCSSIGGETGQAAIDHHVTIGVDAIDFPLPDTSHFESWAVNTVNSSTKTTGNLTLENIRIEANTNPTFSGNITLRGVVFIKTPNVVQFHGNLDVTGVVVCDGDWKDNSGTNQLIFSGNVSCQSVSELPEDSQYDGLRDETGTFLLAPGFAVSFGGNFGTLSGCIAANGITFYGNAGGTVNGSIINYSDQGMTFTGNTDISIDRSKAEAVPAGFSSSTVLACLNQTYDEY